MEDIRISRVTRQEAYSMLPDKWRRPGMLKPGLRFIYGPDADIYRVLNVDYEDVTLFRET